MDVEDDSVNEVSVEQIDVETQSNSVSPTLSFVMPRRKLK